MPRRRGWKRGEWLAKDEESGFVVYGKQLRRDYYGVLTKDGDSLHPQTFIKPKNDPYPVTPISVPNRDYDLSQSVIGFYVENTTVPIPVGAATHLFRTGVGVAEIEYDLFVY